MEPRLIETNPPLRITTPPLPPPPLPLPLPNGGSTPPPSSLLMMIVTMTTVGDQQWQVHSRLDHMTYL